MTENPGPLVMDEMVRSEEVVILTNGLEEGPAAVPSSAFVEASSEHTQARDYAIEYVPHILDSDFSDFVCCTLKGLRSLMHAQKFRMYVNVRSRDACMCSTWCVFNVKEIHSATEAHQCTINAGLHVSNVLEICQL